MNAEHQPWQIQLRAKAKNFDFKFKATKYLPACYNFFRFSVFLRIFSLIIRVNSDNHQPTRRKSWKSKITGFVDKFRSLYTKRKTFVANKSSKIKKGPICSSTVVIWKLARLIESIFEKDVKWIVVHCFRMLLYILTLLKTFIRTKNNNFILVLILSMVGCPLWLHMKNNSSHRRRTFAWRHFG